MLIDLKYQRNQLDIRSKYDAIHQQSELEELRQKLKYLKIERRRKETSVKESKVRLEKLSHHEEMLEEELQIVKSELILLESKMRSFDATANGGGDYMCGNDDVGVQKRVKIIA